MKRRILEVLTFALAITANAQTPVITSQPQSLTNNSGSTATFTVVATDAATYQWQLNGTIIAGATDSTLTYDDLSTNQAGTYTVVVANGSGATNSLPASLTVVQGTQVQFRFSGFPGRRRHQRDRPAFRPRQAGDGAELSSLCHAALLRLVWLSLPGPFHHARSIVFAFSLVGQS